MSTRKENPDRVEEFVALLWGAFGQGAGMPFDADCVVEVRERRYYENVEGNCSELSSDDAYWQRTLRCARKAGRIAAASALEDGRDRIALDDFRDACDMLEKIQERIRAQSEGGGASPQFLGGVCG